MWNMKEYDINDNIINEIYQGKGKIKEYYKNGNLKFVGEYLNGNKNGIGKEYYNDGLLKFEGEYINGKKNGKGKEHNKNENLKFDGEYYNNYRIKGKEYIMGKLVYDGEYLCNKKFNGKGYDDKLNILYELNSGSGKIIECHDNCNLKL